MFQKTKVWRGLTVVFALFLVFSLMAANSSSGTAQLS